MISVLFNEVFTALISFHPVYTFRVFVHVFVCIYMCVYRYEHQCQTSIVMNLAICRCIHCKHGSSTTDKHCSLSMVLLTQSSV